MEEVGQWPTGVAMVLRAPLLQRCALVRTGSHSQLVSAVSKLRAGACLGRTVPIRAKGHAEDARLPMKRWFRRKITVLVHRCGRSQSGRWNRISANDDLSARYWFTNTN